MAVPPGFAPHPEGGTYREVWRATHRPRRTRDAVTSIGFHLEPGEHSRWHRVHGAAELWVWNGGGQLRLSLGGTGAAPGEVREVLLGPGDQHLVEPDEWQSAAPVGEAVTVACVVSPGFDLDDLEIHETAAAEPTRVLFVCEGNMCRSPTAELLLRSALAERGAADRFAVSSAGLRTEDGLPMEPHAAAALRGVAPVDTSSFRTRQLREVAADLILTATIRQRDAIVEAVPAAREVTFAWNELLGLADAAPVAAASLEDLLRQLRSRRGLVHGDYDVPDPIGWSTRTFEQTAESIADSVRRLADLLV